MALILLDMMMPEMDGWQFRDAQLADPALRSIPVVVVTAHNDAADIADEIGAAAFLRKPVGFEALLTTIRRAADGQQRGPG